MERLRSRHVQRQHLTARPYGLHLHPVEGEQAERDEREDDVHGERRSLAVHGSTVLITRGECDRRQVRQNCVAGTRQYSLGYRHRAHYEIPMRTGGELESEILIKISSARDGCRRASLEQ